jgi:cytoskeletal protein RodZ
MSLAETLKKAREGRNLGLEDISKKTRISVKFLEKIENGNYDFAPEPYVRAFIRSYARVVGLNPDEVIKLYENEVASLRPKEEKKEEKKVQFDIVSFISENTLWLIGGFIILAMVFFIFFSVEEKNTKLTKQVQKKGFETAVEEISRISPAESVKSESEVDSLELKIMATDTVWFSVIIDSAQVREFLMSPNTSLSLKAKDNFNFTIGNAGGIKFILNGHELEQVGRKGAVVKNYVINREKLKSVDLKK